MGIEVCSGNLCVRFGSTPLERIEIAAKDGSAVFIEDGRQELFVRAVDQVSEPIYLRHVNSLEPDNGGARCELVDESGEYRAEVDFAPSSAGLRFSVRAVGPTPIWMVEWRLCGMDLREIVVPALGGQSVTDQMPDGERLAYKYPFWWNAQFALGMTGPDSGVWWRTMETDPRFKLLRIERRNGLFDITIGFEAEAPLKVGEVAGEFFLDTFTGGWKSAAAVHGDWLRDEFRLVPLDAHPSFPRWASDVNVVLELWGMRRDLDIVLHTFDDMIRRIDEFAERHPPGQTLLYLPGFSHNGIDSRIPEYVPSEKLGGSDGFARLVERAHALGYRVMIHTNVLGMTYNHPLYARFKEHQVVDVFDRPQGWAMDLDGDWLTEPYFAYINPGNPEWSELMAETLGALIREFDLDAVFLDQTLLAFNVSSGPNFVRGMRNHVERLQAAFPDVLFAGEGVNEHVLPALPMVQIHGIDSIAGVHGMEGTLSWRRVHPVLTHTFGPHTRFVGHLLTKHPSHPVFGRQESAYRELGVVPALVCYGRDQELAGPGLDEVLERARQITPSSRPHS